MTRVLMVSTISRFLRDFLFPYADHYRARGWQVDALTSRVDEFPECRRFFQNVWEVSWSRSPLTLRKSWQSAKRIREIVDREQYDIVHVHTPVAAFVTRFVLRGLRKTRNIKVIYTAHGFHFSSLGSRLRNSIFLTLEKVAGRWTDHLVVINADDAHAALEHQLTPEGKVWHFPGIGVNVDYYNPRAIPDHIVELVRQGMDVPPSAPLFSVVAEFIPRKRHYDILKAFSMLQYSQVHLALAGYGPLMPALKAYALELGVADRVHFLGFQNDVRALIRASDALILASNQEGLARCIMESMALEVPVIGTDIRGIRDLLEDGAGVLVPPGNTQSLLQAMNWIIDNPD